MHPVYSGNDDTLIERIEVFLWQSLHHAYSLDLRLIMIFTMMLMLLSIGLHSASWKVAQKSTACIIANCWFCNTDNSIDSNLENCWYCVHCEQYNGFTKDGDYNKEIISMYLPNNQILGREDLINSTEHPADGKLCESCNRMQILKIKQLGSFVPRNEDTFDTEIIEYRSQLENRYKICNRCSEMLQRYIADQDLQIRNAYGDVESFSTDKREEIKTRLENEDSIRVAPRSLKYLSLLWPSNLLSLLSFFSAWCLVLSSITGIFQKSFRIYFLIGCSSRLLIWLMNPFSKRKFMLLLTWLILFVLAPITSYVGYDMLWFRFAIVILESWNSMWSLLITILLFPLNRILGVLGIFRAKKTEEAKEAKEAKKKGKTPEKTSPHASLTKTSNPPVTPDEKPRNVCRIKRRQVHSDSIDGRIGTMSLGLTDSEDESGQIKRHKSNHGSWYASASRFVTEADTTKPPSQSNSKTVQSKFQLQPPRLLYPNLDTIRCNEPTSRYERQFNEITQRPEALQMHNEKSNHAGKSSAEKETYRSVADDVHRRMSNETKDFRKVFQFAIKLICAFAAIASVFLNIYLLKTKNQEKS